MNLQPTQQLTLAELERCRPVAGEGGRSLRAFCPFHGSDKQRSLRVSQETRRFQCFACGVWGYLADGAQTKRERDWKPLPVKERRVARESRVDLPSLLQRYQRALPGSWGEKYLFHRGIPLALATGMGVGYAPSGAWAHPARDWRWGRLVFPHTAPDGRVVNLYGRAVGSHDKVPKHLRHDHLPGEKGYFNAPALLAERVVVCEGPFDALALMAAGLSNVVAIYGVDGWRWEWAFHSKELVFALDNDEAGSRWSVLGREALLRGKQVTQLDGAAYGGHKDANEAWCQGVLRLS